MAKKTLQLGKVYQIIEQGPVVMVSTSYEGIPNVMTMSWHMMIDFEPPILACVISDQNYTFDIIKKTKECVVNIPTKEQVVLVRDVGNVSGRDVNKFSKFKINHEPASTVLSPLLTDCYANLECKVIDTKMAKKYNIFILEVVKAWVHPTKTRPKLIHHAGYGAFTVDGDIIKLKSHVK